MALDVFTSARAALESTRGTDLTPTRLIYAETFEHEHTVATIRPQEHRNSYESVFSAAAGPERSSVTMQGRVSYDDLIWHANMFYKAVASGTGGGADKTWTFTPSNSTDDVKTHTLQLGYSDTIASAPGIKLNYGMGDELNIHYEKNDDGAATFSARYLYAKALTQITAFTGSLTDRTVTPASCNNTVVYIDTSTIGTTADSAVVSADFTLNLEPVPFYALDGTTAAQATFRPKWRTWRLVVTRQYNAATEFTAFQAKTTRKIRIRTTGPALGGSNYRIDQDCYGVWTERSWADVDGIITEQLTLEPVYDTTTSTSTSLTVVNATSAIT